MRSEKNLSWGNAPNPAPRGRGDRGATLVEYVLVLCFLVALSVGGIQALGAAGKAEVGNQAECVSRRPPPVSCQIPIASTTTTTR